MKKPVLTALFAFGQGFSNSYLEVWDARLWSKADGFPHLGIVPKALDKFLMDVFGHLHHLERGLSTDELVAYRFMELCLAKRDNVSLRSLLTSNDEGYMEDIVRNLLEPVRQTLVSREMNFQFPSESVLMADALRDVFTQTDLGRGSQRLRDRTQHIANALLHQALGQVVIAVQVAEGTPYLMCMDNQEVGELLDIGLKGQIRQIPSKVANQMAFRLCGKSRFSNRLANDVVNAYRQAIVYRFGATRSKNNHGGDSVAVLAMDDDLIDNYVNGLVNLSHADRILVERCLKNEPDRFRICAIESKTSQGSRSIEGLLFNFRKRQASSFARYDFFSYADELSNVAAHVNDCLKSFGVSGQLPTVSMFQVSPTPNWNPNHLLDFSTPSFFEGGYANLLQTEDPVDAVSKRLGGTLRDLVCSASNAKALERCIIEEAILPHMRVRQVLADASKVEEFFLSGMEFKFNPARIGMDGNREGHISITPIDPSNPPQIPVRILNETTSIILHPSARSFRLKGGELVFGFDIASDHLQNPFILSEPEILGHILPSEVASPPMVETFEGVLSTRMAMFRKGKRKFFVNDSETAELSFFLDLARNGSKKEIVDFLLCAKSDHFRNYFCQVILDRLLRNPGHSGFLSLFHEGNHYRLYKVLETWGSTKFIGQLEEYAFSHTRYPFRYDQIVICARESFPFKKIKKEGKRKMQSTSTVRKKVEDVIESRYEIALGIAEAKRSRLRVSMKNLKYWVMMEGLPFPLRGPYFDRNDFTNFETMKDLIFKTWVARENKWFKGIEFLRFPITLERKGHGSIALSHPFVKLQGTLKQFWNSMDALVAFGSAHSHSINTFREAITSNIRNITPENMQATLELAYFGASRTQFSSVFGIVTDWLVPEVLEQVDTTAQMHVESIQSIKFNETTISRENVPLKVNDSNRLLWYTDAIINGKQHEIPLQINEENLGIASLLLGKHQDTLRKGFKISDLKMKPLKPNNQTIDLFMKIFIRQHLVSQDGYKDMVNLFEKRVLVQYTKPKYKKAPIFSLLDKKERDAQIREVAAVISPNGVVRAPSGRFIGCETLLLAKESPFSFHFLDAQQHHGNLPKTIALHGKILQLLNKRWANERTPTR